MRIRNQANSSTLVQFDEETMIVINEPSLIEQASFDTELKPRYGLKDIVKRRTGLKNKKIHLQVLFAGASLQSNFTTFINALADNEFIYFDSEGHQTRLDGVYAATGTPKQKYHADTEILIADVDLVEKED